MASGDEVETLSRGGARFALGEGNLTELRLVATKRSVQVRETEE